MNTSRRFFGNTFLAFISSIVAKASGTLLFILIGRTIGPDEAGIFNLAATYFTIIFALSDWGLHELLIREVAPRRGESSRYLVNYMAMRLILAVIAYVALLLLLRSYLPYDEYTKYVIQVLTLSIFPEAVFSLCQALFTAHEQFLAPTAAAVVSSGFRLLAGSWILSQNSSAADLVWVMPVGSMLGLIVYLPALYKLLQRTPQYTSLHLELWFSLSQLRYTPGFVIIGLFLTLDFQLDTLLISLFLSKTELGWYGAAQTVMLGFWMMPLAIRSAIYPLMARYYYEEPAKLAQLYRKANHYLLIASLPIAAGVSLLAGPIVTLIFSESFMPAASALQWMIWAVVFAFLNVPNARLMLVHNRQQQAGWITGLSMVTNLVLNLLLIPPYGIVGAAIARSLSTTTLFLALYLYVQHQLLHESMLPLLVRPLLATIIMAATVWLLRDRFLFWPVAGGVISYIGACFLLGAIPVQDRRYFCQLIKA